MKATQPVYVRGQVVGEEPDWKGRRENAAKLFVRNPFIQGHCWLMASTELSARFLTEKN